MNYYNYNEWNWHYIYRNWCNCIIIKFVMSNMYLILVIYSATSDTSIRVRNNDSTRSLTYAMQMLKEVKLKVQILVRSNDVKCESTIVVVNNGECQVSARLHIRIHNNSNTPWGVDAASHTSDNSGGPFNYWKEIWERRHLWDYKWMLDLFLSCFFFICFQVYKYLV